MLLKKLTVFFIVLALCFCTFFSANSIYIDGYDSGTEWESAETQLLLNGESNCKVNFGLIKCIFDPEINTAYLCIMFQEPNLSQDNKNVGVSLQIENSEPFVVSASSVTNNIDVDKYYFDGILTIDENNGVTTEIQLGIKHGLPAVLNGKVRFYDSEGVPSNVYSFSIVNSESTTQKSNHSGYYENSGTDKTTKALAEETTLKSSKTTTKKNKENTTKDNWAFLDLLLPEETTTKKTEKNTKKKTESSVKTTKAKSHTSKAVEITEEINATETVTVLITQTVQTASHINNDIGLQEGDIYKTITLIAGGLSLVVISFVGTVRAKKDKHNENDPKS